MERTTIAAVVLLSTSVPLAARNCNEIACPERRSMVVRIAYNFFVNRQIFMSKKRTRAAELLY